jgi:PAS domain S-box-containing protein
LSRLSEIGDTVQQVAEAISAALGVETEIVDSELTVVAGTSKYRLRVGDKLEWGDRNAGFLYGRVMNTREPYVVENPASDPTYDPSSLKGETEELAEICSPIMLLDEVLGVIGFAAFNSEQRKTLLSQRDTILLFLRRMADMIASKVSETEGLERLRLASSQMTTILETISEGVLTIDGKGVVTHANRAAEAVTGIPRRELVWKPLASRWPNSCVLEVLRTGREIVNREEIYGSQSSRVHVFTSARPVLDGDSVVGVVASLRDVSDVRRLVYAVTDSGQRYGFDDIKGQSETLLEVKDKALRIAGTNSTVLITGESGTGKELFARAIHHESLRGSGPFITVNCGAIPESLLESELFGYEGGAFTGARREGKSGKFELADGGTIFLDEIGDLPLHLQVKLLNVLQTRRIDRIGGRRTFPVDVRIIAATNRDLETMIRDGEFRSDLFFRLNVIPIYIPPLRERKEDIPVLLEAFLRKHSGFLGRNFRGFSKAAMSVLWNYDWPGNVRELENAVEYAANMETGETITIDSVPFRVRKAAIHGARDESLSLKKRIREQERDIIESCLMKYGDSRESKERIARMLKISRTTLYRKIQELGITLPVRRR